MPADFNLLNEICTVDVEELEVKEHTYGDSWNQRGGVGAFMMLARKWDRLENQCKEQGYDVFKTIEQQGPNKDGVLDDIRDLRRYLLLVEQHMINLYGTSFAPTQPTTEPDGGYVDQD